MLATGVSAPCAKVQSHRRRHAPCHRLPVASNTNQLCPRFSSAIMDEPRRRRRTEAAGLPFFGGLGCLPLLVIGPFFAAIFAVWSVLATIQFIIVSTILLGAAAAAAFLVLPQARTAAKLFFSKDKDAEAGPQASKRRSNVVIDIEPDPEVKRSYEDLDDELRRFDEEMRNRRR